MRPFSWTRHPVVEASAYLILNEELDTLDGGSSCFRDGGGNTTHCDALSVRVFVSYVWAVVKVLNALFRLLASDRLI